MFGLFKRKQTIEDHGECPQCHTPLRMASGIGAFCPEKRCPVGDDISLWETSNQPVVHADDCSCLGLKGLMNGRACDCGIF